MAVPGEKNHSIVNKVIVYLYSIFDPVITY